MFLWSCDRRRTDEADKVKVLSAGADDYICKPFGLAELAIRIEVVLIRMKPVTWSCIVFDRFAIDSARREATLNNRIIKLTAWEFKILYFLASHFGQSWSRQQLIEKIWDGTATTQKKSKLLPYLSVRFARKWFKLMLLGLGLLKLLGVMVIGSIRRSHDNGNLLSSSALRTLCGEKPIFPRAVGQPDAS